MDDDLINAAMTCAATVFGPVRLESETLLRGSDRSIVARLALGTDQGRHTVILKTASARERAALEVLGEIPTLPVPRLLAAHDDPPLILMEDVGDHDSLADLVLGNDPAAATDGVERWAESIARVQASSLGVGTAFRDRLAALPPDQPGDDVRNRLPERTDGMIEDAVTQLTERLPKLGVTVDPDAFTELRAIADRLRVDPADVEGPGALTPCDACPDNNVETPEGLRLIDFEWAEFRHVAWDAAYLAVPWPTCWCCWRLPDDVVASALAQWRRALAPSLSPAVVAGLEQSVRDATVVWSVITSGWFLQNAIDGYSFDPEVPRPGVRELTQHRLGVAVATAPDGPLRRMVSAAYDATLAAWGEQPLLVAPAWR